MLKKDSLPITFTGIVKKGQQLGRQLGYPTANLFSEDGALPNIAYGVYTGWTTFDGKRYPSMMSFGRAKTVGSKEILFETHLLGYQGNLYGKKLTVKITAFLRDMIKFESVEELINAMKKDEKQARKFLKEN